MEICYKLFIDPKRSSVKNMSIQTPIQLTLTKPKNKHSKSNLGQYEHKKQLSFIEQSFKPQNKKIIMSTRSNSQKTFPRYLLSNKNQKVVSY